MHSEIHFQVISRASGRSAVRAASYRSAEKLFDERAQQVCDYTRKQHVKHTEISAPAHAPDWMRDRDQLHNGIEAKERRKDAQLLREGIKVIPRGLDDQQQIAYVRGYVQEAFVAKGMVADWSIHESPSVDGQTNPHAHILLTMREIEGDGFGKKNRDWNSTETLMEWRGLSEKHANAALEKAQRPERVDYRPNREKSPDRKPEPKLGPKVAGLERRGIRTERGDAVPRFRHQLAVQRWLSAGVQRAAKARSAAIEYLRRREWTRERQDARNAAKTTEKTWQQKETDRDNEPGDRGPDFER